MSQLPGRWHLPSLLGIEAEAKTEVYEQISALAEVVNVKYWLQIFLAAGIATFGLVQSSPAVLIGAMLISPLMGPIMATGLALAVGDVYLGIRVSLKLAISIAAAILFSAFLVWLLPFHSATSEIAARTNPNLLDLGIALLSGVGGAIAVYRGKDNDAMSLPGVAIAVALMPPLCTVGFGIGGGWNTEIMTGAGLLFLTNLVAIVASAFAVFLLMGMNTHAMQDTISRHYPPGGRLRWRILMLLVMLAVIAVPLRRALMQVASETVTRNAIETELRQLAPSGGLVSQQVSVGRTEIRIRLISTAGIPTAQVTAARERLMRRTGRDVSLTVDAVASKNEIADIMQRLATPAPTPRPVEKPLDELQRELVHRASTALDAVWPVDEAPLRGFQLILGPEAPVIAIEYDRPRDVDPLVLTVVERELRLRLALPALTVKASRAATAPGRKSASAALRSGR